MINRIVSAIAAVALSLAILVPFYVADLQQAEARGDTAQAGHDTVVYEVDLTRRSVSSASPGECTGRAGTAPRHGDTRSIPAVIVSDDTTKGGRHVPAREKACDRAGSGRQVRSKG